MKLLGKNFKLKIFYQCKKCFIDFLDLCQSRNSNRTSNFSRASVVNKKELNKISGWNIDFMDFCVKWVALGKKGKDIEWRKMAALEADRGREDLRKIGAYSGRNYAMVKCIGHCITKTQSSIMNNSVSV